MTSCVGRAFSPTTGILSRFNTNDNTLQKVPSKKSVRLSCIKKIKHDRNRM